MSVTNNNTGQVSPGGEFGGTSSSGGDTSGAGSGKPIVLDLDGDGIEVALGATSPAFFDFDNDGFREQTAWVGADDALLVIDLAADGTAGADGVIDQAKELAFAGWSDTAATDLDGLREAFDK